MRPAAYSGIVASFLAFPAPNEKDATPGAYRPRRGLALQGGVRSLRGWDTGG